MKKKICDNALLTVYVLEALKRYEVDSSYDVIFLLELCNTRHLLFS